MLVTHTPAAPLAWHIDTLWFSSRARLPHVRERSLPAGRFDIVIPLLQDSIVRFDSVDALSARHYRGAIVSGAHDRFQVRGMDGASCVIGVHFHPGGAAAFFGGAVRKMQNQTILLDELWGAAAVQLRERLQAESRVSARFQILEEFLLARLRSTAPVDAMVPWALQWLARHPAEARVGAIQRASGCSPAQFTRRFEAAVGITPKRYARVLRFNAILPRIARGGKHDWARFAVENGFFDQSHLVNEFRRFAGVTPTAYSPVHASQTTHVPIREAV